jgi:multiple sugar transport system ATP-binding protein
MAFALRNLGVAKDEIATRVAEAARVLQLGDLLDRKPGKMSGGQRQRVAMGRAIVREPKVFCMDEPLSNLDAKLRVSTRAEIAGLQKRLGTTTVYVTHDQTEAMTMADRIVVLRDGKVQQIATPQVMYDQPDNVFVAGFIGSPAMNFIAARLVKENGSYEVVFGNTRLGLTEEEIGRAGERGYDPASFTGKDVILGIRPEHIEDAGTEAAEGIGGSEGSNTMEVDPQVIESMGSEKYLYFEVGGEQAAHLESLGDMTDDETSGDENGGGSADESGEMMVARVAAESTAKEGQKMRLVIDSSKVQLFDPETEKAIF